jgi:hypothetical protein
MSERVERRCGLARCAPLALLLALSACAEDPGELQVSMPDRMQFDAEVYPVLLRDCAFHACHGSSERFFQVLGSGRGRLLPTTRPLDPSTVEEITHSYERARSMIDPKNPAQSLLLRKPLASEAGGTGHEGVDELGRNVYQTAMEPGYAAIERWVFAAPPAMPATQPMQ